MSLAGAIAKVIYSLAAGSWNLLTIPA